MSHRHSKVAGLVSTFVVTSFALVLAAFATGCSGVSETHGAPRFGGDAVVSARAKSASSDAVPAMGSDDDTMGRGTSRMRRVTTRDARTARSDARMLMGTPNLPKRPQR